MEDFKGFKMDLFVLGRTKKLVVIDDLKGSKKSYSIVLDLGSLVACGDTPQDAIEKLKTQLARSLEAIFKLDFENYEIRKTQGPLWEPEILDFPDKN